MRTPDDLRMFSFELNYCKGQFFSQFVPMLAHMDQPIPILSIWVFSVGAIIITRLLGAEETPSLNRDKSYDK